MWLLKAKAAFAGVAAALVIHLSSVASQQVQSTAQNPGSCLPKQRASNAPRRHVSLPLDLGLSKTNSFYLLLLSSGHVEKDLHVTGYYFVIFFTNNTFNYVNNSSYNNKLLFFF